MPVNLPTIKNVEEARDALADVLQAVGRPGQIIGMMEKIMFCRAVEPRRFLSDALDGLVKGGLEELREKRRKALEKKQAEDAARAKELEAQIQETSAQRREDAVEEAAAQAEDADAPVPIVIVPPAEEIKILEELGTQLDALNLAAVAREIFPDLKTKAQPWEVGRAIFLHEQEAREFLLQGARLKDHERATMLAPAWDAMQRLIENSRPDWAKHAPEMRSLVDDYFAANPPVNGGADATVMFEVLLMRDDHVRELLVLLGADRPAALEAVGALRSKLDQLLEFEAGRKE
ncbi:MAG TPA: hypothetical protein VJU16_03280 [Planctomycetota bacterium]|nr:hypothetical protein [Planctomycetota bacterium]